VHLTEQASLRRREQIRRRRRRDEQTLWLPRNLVELHIVGKLETASRDAYELALFDLQQILGESDIGGVDLGEVALIAEAVEEAVETGCCGGCDDLLDKLLLLG
jgi:hypothetical protein